jgi:hypothetical protein
MKAGAKALLLAAVLLGGCRATRDVTVTSYHVARGAAVGSYRVTRAVAVGSYRVATAPVKVLRGHSDDPPQTTTTTSDVTTPGYPVPTTSQGPSRQQSQPPERVASSSTSATAAPSGSAVTKPKASPPPRSAATQLQFPTAKPVPGRAGLVYNPFDPNGGGYIDVSGYPPGTKVKDPDSQKIFIVP